MTRRMLINTRQSEELRVALTNNQSLFDFDIESKFHNNRTGNIYLGTISRVEPSLNAAFVSYGSERHAFLPFKEILPSYLDPKVDASDMKNALKEGTRVIIQVNKDERGNKGAAVSTFITLAGCYLVVMPENERAGGISRRIEGEERQQLKDAMRQLKHPKGVGVICRTAGLGRSAEELQWDLDVLLKTWGAIKSEADSDRKSPFLIYRESDVIQRSIRDYLRQGIDEIVVDTKDGFDEISNHIRRLRPDFIDHLKLYEDERPLFAKYHIENQIESAYSHEVTLPSGGSIVFDHTEALTAIDINSAKATKGGDIEETALQTNLEAAAEIARQSRLRDLGGLLVIDFIDMIENANGRTVEDAVVKAFSHDRARVQFGRISRFGLFEMSRQRLRPSLKETTDANCPRCEGRGLIRSIESLTISILRHLQDEVLQKRYLEIHVQLPVDVATFMLNEKRAQISELEANSGVKVALIPNPEFQTPQYSIRRHKKATSDHKSYELREKATTDAHAFTDDASHAREIPALQAIEVPEPPKQRKIGLLTRIWQDLFGEKRPTQSTSTRNPNANRRRNTNNRSKTQNNKQRSSNQGSTHSNTNQNTNASSNKRKNDQNATQNNRPNRQKPQQNKNRRNNGPNNQPPQQTQTKAEQKGPNTRPQQRSKKPIENNTPKTAPNQAEIVINLDQPAPTPMPKSKPQNAKPTKAHAKPVAKKKAPQANKHAPVEATTAIEKPAETKTATKPKTPRKGSVKASDILAKAKKPDSKIKQSVSKSTSETAAKLNVEQVATKTKAPTKKSAPAKAKKSPLKQVETKQ